MARKAGKVIITTIATLGSHCSLQVLKGAKDEGFKTLLVCEKRRVGLYERFGFIDEMIVVDKFSEVAGDRCRNALGSTGRRAVVWSRRP